MLRVVVCVSGGGTNLQAILDAVEAGRITNTEIIAVISNNEGAYALERARAHQIPGIVMSPKAYEDRAEFNRVFTEKLCELAPDLIVLAGFLVKTIGESGSKESRAEPFAAQWQAGNVDVLIGEWNEMYFNQLESFPESKFKDMVDASSSAFNEVESGATFSAPPKDTLSKSSYWRG